MTLEKAIKIVEDENRFHPRVEYPDQWDARQTLIEAGKRLRQNRNFKSDIDLSPLPGETED